PRCRTRPHNETGGDLSPPVSVRGCRPSARLGRVPPTSRTAHDTAQRTETIPPNDTQNMKPSDTGSRPRAPYRPQRCARFGALQKNTELPLPLRTFGIRTAVSVPVATRPALHCVLPDAGREQPRRIVRHGRHGSRMFVLAFRADALPRERLMSIAL